MSKCRLARIVPRVARLMAMASAMFTLAAPVLAQAARLAEHEQLARDVFQQLIEINTTDAANTTEAAEAMAARLLAAGFPPGDVQVLGPHPRKGNLIARMRGSNSGRRPLLLLAHLDVVEARPEDWSVDPFTFLERDGFFYGRGTTDDKAMAAIFVANLIRLRRDGFTPDRDIILALTADEEGGDYNGVAWLLANHRELVDAEYGLNEGGGGQIKDGRRVANQVQTSEKVYLDFILEVTNAGGHSSLPIRDNAIYHLTGGLERLAAFEFPIALNETTRAFFERMSRTGSGATAADMLAVSRVPLDTAAARRLAASSAYYNAIMRTTCVTTRLDAGHANNALPQMARATVNCRILPGESAAEVQRTLARVLANERIRITPNGVATPSPPSPLRPEVMRPIERITEAMWPGVPVIPVMLTGATDGLYFRNAGVPIYGVSGLFGDQDDVRAHGRDERIGVTAFFEGQEFLHRLMMALSSPQP